MRTIILVMLCFIIVDVAAAITEDGRLAIRNGALGKYLYRVVDDEGNAVSNAHAHVCFKSYGRPQDEADWVVWTDTNGMFAIEHRFNEKFSVGIDKEGYYHSYDEINYLQMEELPVENGKWQPYGETRTLVLKRIKNPVSIGEFNRCSQAIPVYDKWVGFDFERREWVHPYGNGRFKDVLLKFGRTLTHRQTDYKMTMEVSFTNNPYAGCYQMKEDNYSERKTVYNADSNATFRATLNYIQERHPAVGKQDNRLDNDFYLVFRTRTQTDDNGNLVSAHYGIIRGKWSFFDTMLSGGYLFNSTPNDTNLEDLETARRSKLSYRQRNNER